MERHEALEVLGLGTQATEQEIEHRYMILVKRYKGSDDPKALEDVAEAYNLLTGRTYEAEPPDPRDERVVLGKPVKQWKHIWEYGRVKFIGITAAAIALVSIVYSVVTNVPPDFQVFIVGELYQDEGPQMNNFVTAVLPDVKNFQPNSAFITRSGEDANDVANVQKAFVMIAAGDEDIVIMDELQADRFAPQSAFVELDDLYAKLQAELPAEIMDLVEPFRYKITEDQGGDGQIHIYALDMTKLGTYQALDLYGTRCVMAISVRSKHLEASKTFLSQFIARTESLKLLVTPIPTASPTPATTATAAPTSAG